MLWYRAHWFPACCLANKKEEQCLNYILASSGVSHSQAINAFWMFFQDFLGKIYDLKSPVKPPATSLSQPLLAKDSCSQLRAAPECSHNLHRCLIGPKSKQNMFGVATPSLPVVCPRHTLCKWEFVRYWTHFHSLDVFSHKISRPNDCS